MSQHDSDRDVLTDLDADDATTAEALQALFADVTLDRSLDSVIPTESAHTGRRKWLMLTAAAVACGVVGGAIIVGTGGGEKNLAFAEWTPIPVPVSAADRAAIEAACEESLASHDDAGFPEAPQLDGAVIDLRGNIAAVSLRQDDLELECAAQRRVDGWMSFASGMGIGDGDGRPSLMRAFNSDAEINLASGFAPRAVSVEVEIPDLPVASAPVVDGQYVVWLPFTFDWTDDPTAVQVRYLDADGTVIETTHP